MSRNRATMNTRAHEILDLRGNHEIGEKANILLFLVQNVPSGRKTGPSLWKNPVTKR